MKSLKNVLKYPGSKWRIADRLVAMIPEHHTYLEPYFGSGAVFFKKAPSDIEMINDMDGEVVNLFMCIREDASRLARLISTTPFSREIYDNTYNNITIEDDYVRALQFLVRCWQGHGFRTNGYKVGWKNDVQGRERMYALWNWYRLPDWVVEIADRLKTVQIDNRPALEVIKRFNYDNVFMYIDPPYILGTRTGKQYKHEMTDHDHETLLQELLMSKAKIMLSGYGSDIYDDLLCHWYRKEFKSQAEHGKNRTEVLWTNYC